MRCRASCAGRLLVAPCCSRRRRAAAARAAVADRRHRRLRRRASARWRTGSSPALQLPLIARGARLPASGPSDGVDGATRGRAARGDRARLQRVGRVQHAHARSRAGSSSASTSTSSSRAASVSLDGLPLRELARRYPHVALRRRRQRPARGDAPAAGGQPLPGRGRLRPGCRRAGDLRLPSTSAGDASRVLPDDWVAGWDAETAFVREFCALGGRVVERRPAADPGPSAGRGS